MGQQIISRFNQYDLFGYMLVGSIATLVFLIDLKYFFNISFPELKLDATIIIWFIAVYFIGNIVQGIVTVLEGIKDYDWVKRHDSIGLSSFASSLISAKSDYTKEQRQLLYDVRKILKIKTNDYKHIWNACYMWVLSKESGQVQSMGSYFSLYRGWEIIFLIQIILLVFIIILKLIFHEYSMLPFSIIFLVASILLTYIFRNRAQKFYKHQTEKVLQFFSVFKNSKQNFVL